MNPRVLPGLFTWLSVVAVASACSPLSPDTVLDNPRASLEVPPISYLAELHRLAKTSRSPVEEAAQPETTPFIAQIPLEKAELRLAWRSAGLAPAEIDQRLARYAEVRKTLLSGVSSTAYMEFKMADGTATSLAENPLGADFPPDVSDYVEACRLHAIGKQKEARALWRNILDRPADTKRFRGVWAAWMLAKTASDPSECAIWYERTEWEASQGGLDILQLAPAAKAWRGPRADDQVSGLCLSYEAFRSGRETAAIDIRRISQRILENKAPDILAKAASNPIARQLINLELHASRDKYSYDYSDSDNSEFIMAWPPREWLSALEAHSPLPLEEGARVAWTLYSVGRYDESRHWLELSDQDDSLAHWLHAKFDLRSGNLESANSHLATAIRQLSSQPDWKPFNYYLEAGWMDSAEERLSATQGRLMADAGIVALAREDYTSALESLRLANYDEDAAYVAEWVLSTDELIKHVRKVAPNWDSTTPQSSVVDPAICFDHGQGLDRYWAGGINNRLRYQLGRRLAREGRLDEAMEFMPPGLAPLLDHYRNLQSARTSGKYSDEALAAIIWRQARIHRHWGAELFSTDSSPDGGIQGWAYEVPKLPDMRLFREGWYVIWGEEERIIANAEFSKNRAVPLISFGEIQRIKQHSLPDTHRYHYRYVAAKIAAAAAECLPENHPQLAGIYNTAGLWIADSDAQAADYLYQAMVKRCKETDAGKNADSQRWFLRDLDSLGDLPSMPAGLIPEPRKVQDEEEKTE